MERVSRENEEPWITDEDEEYEGRAIAHKWKAIIGGLVLATALGYFGFMAFNSATVYYYTVGEMNDVGVTAEGRMVRVSGKLISDTFLRGEDSTIAFFELTDGTETMAAQHDGVLPDLFFNDHSEIILEGAYTADNVFVSQNVIVKCPSKYIALDPADQAEAEAQAEGSGI